MVMARSNFLASSGQNPFDTSFLSRRGTCPLRGCGYGEIYFWDFEDAKQLRQESNSPFHPIVHHNCYKSLI